MALREVLAVFRVDVQGIAKMREADKGMKKLVAAAKELGQALVGGAVVVGIKNFVQGQVELATGLDQTARILGVTTDELQQFHLAAELSNTSVEAVDSALRFLNRTIGSEGGNGIGAKGAKELGALGIALRDAEGKSRPVIDVFADLADKLKETGDQGKATEIAMQVLGRGGARSLPLLMQGGEALRAKFAELRELGGGISPESIEAAKQLQVEEVRLKYATQSLGSQVMAGLTPALKRGIERLVEMALAFKRITDGTTFFKSAPLFVYAVGIAAGIFGIVKAVKALSIAFSVVSNSLGMTSPALLFLTATLVPLYLAFDDLLGLFSGDKSEIGEVLDQMFGKGYSAQFVTDTKLAWKDLMAQFKGGDWKGFFDDLKWGIPRAVKGFIQLGEAIKFVWHAAKGIGKLSDNEKDPFADAKNDLDAMVGDEDLNRAAKDKAAKIATGAADFMGPRQADVELINKDLPAAPFAGLRPPPAPGRGGAMPAGGAPVAAPVAAPGAPPAHNITVNVYGVKDAHNVPKEINKQMGGITSQNNSTYPAVGGI